jgi:hypothetical protein
MRREDTRVKRAFKPTSLSSEYYFIGAVGAVSGYPHARMARSQRGGSFYMMPRMLEAFL